MRTAPGQGLWDGKRPHESLGTDWLWGLRQEEMTLGTDTFSHHCLCCIGQKLCLSSVGSQANKSNLLGNVPPTPTPPPKVSVQGRIKFHFTLCWVQ